MRTVIRLKIKDNSCIVLCKREDVGTPFAYLDYLGVVWTPFAIYLSLSIHKISSQLLHGTLRAQPRQLPLRGRDALV